MYNRREWIEIGMSGIGHLLPEDDVAIKGFYTTEVQDCISIAISGHGPKMGELFLIHLDTSSKNDKLFKILDIVESQREYYNAKLIFNETYYSGLPNSKSIFQPFIEKFGFETIDRLGLFFKRVELSSNFLIPLNMHSDKNDIDFKVARVGKVEQFDRCYDRIHLYCRERGMKCRHLINFTNRIFANKGELDLDYQFENGKRTPMPEKTDFVKNILSKNDIEIKKIIIDTKNSELIRKSDLVLETIKWLKNELSLLPKGSEGRF